ncbi:hypothetical protein [Cupriavidus sp. UGS-1]|uniref:hypothetical protein n=1 Tax=Cupriavidus sp. UGS-1 TaxID=2899826 RepID=UPI001E519660|nr:hypothetical protein [Cupriavidus sp. UGS-1]MCD9121845.1 hypothetical protein [Cupriavidus sp. UGS-1]
MDKIKEMLQQLRAAIYTTVRIAPACIQFVGQPHHYYSERSRDPDQRLKEAASLLAWLALVLALFQYFVITSVNEIKNPTAYAAGSLFFNVVHLIVMAGAFAIPSKMAERSTPFLTHLANALCATAVLLPTAFLTLSWARIRVQSVLDPSFASNANHWGNFIVLLGYFWMAYHVYRGLRSNIQASRGRSVIATLVGLLVVLIATQALIAANEAIVVQAVTR